MCSSHRTLAVAAGLAAAVLVAVGFLAGRGVTPAGAPGNAKGPAPRRAPASAPAKPRAAYAAAEPAVAHGDSGATSALPADAVRERARDLYRRLEGAVGSRPGLPEELQRDLVAFLTEGEENRASLFGMVWDPSAPRMILGHLKLFLNDVPDEATRAMLVASLESFDPHAAARADAAAKAKDPSLFVASLRAVSSPAERADMLKRLPKSAWSDRTVAAYLLEVAREDGDAEVRCVAYPLLAAGKVREAVPLLAAVAGDAARGERERAVAAFALGLHPDKPSLDDLLGLYEGSPEPVRRTLLASLAEAPSSRRVDDLLVELVFARDTAEKTRRAAANAIGMRLFRLPAEEARDLGSRTAEAVKALPPEAAVTVLTHLGGVIATNQPLKEAIQDLHRTAPAGGAIQLAIASTPSLRFVTGLN